MRFLATLGLLGLGVTIVALGGATDRAEAGATRTPTEPGLRTLRSDVDHYRRLTWTFEQVAHESRRPTSYSYRRSTDRSYLEWTLARWERTAYEARGHALAALRRRTEAPLPPAPRLHAVLGARIAFTRRLTLKLRRIYPGRVSRAYTRARATTASATLQLWQARSAAAALAVARHPRQSRSLLDAEDPLDGAFLCIHRYEGSWNADTGNGYFGGLQMDRSFMQTYGRDFLDRWGTADGWPAWAQVAVAERAYRSGRGFEPWPNSARACGLL